VTEPSTDLDTVQGTDLSSPEDLAKAEQALANVGRSRLENFGATTPRIDVRQSSSKNVPSGIELGDFYNTVTGIGYGPEIEFLVVEAHKGRFLGGKRSPDGNTHAAGDVRVVPDHWPEQYRGRVFSELPEAQERYSEAANAGENEWGKGPAIVDSFNFTGFVTKAAGDDVEPFPVRLSIRATNGDARKAGSKAGALLRSQPNLWSKALKFSTDETQNKGGDEYFVVRVDGYGDEPTNEQRRAAIEAALFAQQIGFLDPDNVVKAEGVGDQPAGESDVVVPGAKGANF
jgi:hypothetical protein